jgi:hypothetical protein
VFKYIVFSNPIILFLFLQCCNSTASLPTESLNLQEVGARLCTRGAYSNAGNAGADQGKRKRKVKREKTLLLLRMQSQSRIFFLYDLFMLRFPLSRYGYHRSIYP